MDSKTQKHLEEAKAYFYSWRLNEAYHCLRRYFDRLPFQPEKEHAEYIGMFARVLAELGKEYELNFYMGELERLHSKLKSPAVAYQLAVVYSYLSPPRLEVAKQIFEDLIENSEAREFQTKAKMMLADYYGDRGNIAACRQLIYSIPEPNDPTLKLLLEIWKARVLRDEGKFDEAETKLKTLLLGLDPKTDWYAYFSTKLILANLYIKEGQAVSAKMILEEIKQLFKGRHFKSVQIQLDSTEKLLREKNSMEVLIFESGTQRNVLSYANKSIQLNCNTPVEKLLLLLAKKGFLDKQQIVKALYSRQYSAERDDKLIYYHVHSLRKRLKSLGLPPQAIIREKNGYRLVPPVERIGENCESERH